MSLVLCGGRCVENGGEGDGVAFMLWVTCYVVMSRDSMRDVRGGDGGFCYWIF